MDIKAPDVAKSAADLKITSKNVSFTGESKKGVKYHVSLDLYAEIDPENSKVNHNDREVELVLRKKELKEEFWPRLLEVKQRVHFLKTDFDKVRYLRCGFGKLMLTGSSGSTRMNRTKSLTRTMRTTSVTSAVVKAAPAAPAVLAVLVVLETLTSRSWVVLTPVHLVALTPVHLPDLVDSLAERRAKVLRVKR